MTVLFSKASSPCSNLGEFPSKGICSMPVTVSYLYVEINLARLPVA